MYSIIDIGSNSIRLLDNGIKTVLTTQLSENMTDCLDLRSIRRTIDGIKELLKTATRPCYVFATEAVRKAANKKDFLFPLYIETGLKVDILNGEAEAEVGFLGATADRNGKCVVIDLGGASCEIIRGQKNIEYSTSLPFGCVKLFNLFGNDFSALKLFVKDSLKNLPDMIADEYIAVGGTATSLAAMAQNLSIYDPKLIDGYVLQKYTILKLIDNIDKEVYPTLDPKRKKVIVQGSYALLCVMEKLGINSLTLSEKDNLEGYAIKHGLL